MLLAAAVVANDTSRRGMQTLVASGSADAAEAVASSRRAAGEGEEEGCWVPYGWRRGGLRRLPPPIPSLGRLARARTSDGRLVISREAAAPRICGGKVEDRLVLRLVDSDDATAPPQQGRRWSHPLAAQDASAPTAIDDDEEEEGIRAAVRSHAPVTTSSLAG